MSKATIKPSPKIKVMKVKESYVILDSGKHSKYTIEVPEGRGIFIKEAVRARNYRDLNKIIGKGLSYSKILPLIKFLDFDTEEIAELAGVSQRTVTRWAGNSIIGVMPSKNLIKVDELVHQGIELFGSEDSFKAWLHQSNVALGDEKPIDLLSTAFGVEMVEDAICSLEYGNVL